MTLTPNDFYGRSCEVSGHILSNYEDTKRCIFCGEFESQQEDRMNTIQSWKEVIELHHAELDKDYPEDLWVDPAEINYDSKEDSSETTGTSSLS
jgi:hypothetical protein